MADISKVKCNNQLATGRALAVDDSISRLMFTKDCVMKPVWISVPSQKHIGDLLTQAGKIHPGLPLAGRFLNSHGPPKSDSQSLPR